MSARASLDGSSPRGRGTPAEPLAARLDRRFIPARAGNTAACPASPSPSTVHPRAGGEHAMVARALALNGGSSPRGRGTRGGLRGRLEQRRFIPARAGNTGGSRSAWACHAVHPRAGGEHLCEILDGRAVGGSSPRGRGTLLDAQAPRLGERFIPARAGNTESWAVHWASPPVHPRAGGEHFMLLTPFKCQDGSSPRGRGTLLRQRRDGAFGRFIPARAGNTTRDAAPRRPPPVHPRAGGEHAMVARALALNGGSSPRGRGTPRRRHRPRRGHRFIPARAGNTGRRICASPSATVHPRAGGEHPRGLWR